MWLKCFVIVVFDSRTWADNLQSWSRTRVFVLFYILDTKSRSRGMPTLLCKRGAGQWWGVRKQGKWAYRTFKLSGLESVFKLSNFQTVKLAKFEVVFKLANFQSVLICMSNLLFCYTLKLSKIEEPTY